MRHVLTFVALACGALALIGLTLWGVASLLLLVISAICLVIAWKLRPRRSASSTLEPRP